MKELARITLLTMGLIMLLIGLILSWWLVIELIGIPFVIVGIAIIANVILGIGKRVGI